MNLKVKTILLAFLMVLLGEQARAAEDNAVVEDSCKKERPVTGSYRLEVGRRTAYSSYLSPFSYRGTGWAVSGFWTKVLPQNPEHLSMHFDTRISYASLLNPAGSASEIDAHASLQWGLEWQKRFNGGWIVGAGGAAGVYGGVLYLLRNSNNPVSAQFSVGIAATGFASKVWRIGRLPVLVADRLTFPLISGFFRQEYGEPYYEIYVGNRHGLAHFGWPGNRCGVDNLLSVTLDFGRTAMEVGYRFSVQNEQANHLTTRFFNHAFVIGVIPGGLGIKQKRNVITPLY